MPSILFEKENGANLHHQLNVNYSAYFFYTDSYLFNHIIHLYSYFLQVMGLGSIIVGALTLSTVVSKIDTDRIKPLMDTITADGAQPIVALKIFVTAGVLIIILSLLVVILYVLGSESTRRLVLFMVGIDQSGKNIACNIKFIRTVSYHMNECKHKKRIEHSDYLGTSYFMFLYQKIKLTKQLRWIKG